MTAAWAVLWCPLAWLSTQCLGACELRSKPSTQLAIAKHAAGTLPHRKYYNLEIYEREQAAKQASKGSKDGKDGKSSKQVWFDAESFDISMFLCLSVRSCKHIL
jgi:hypothetical protein